MSSERYAEESRAEHDELNPVWGKKLENASYERGKERKTGSLFHFSNAERQGTGCVPMDPSVFREGYISGMCVIMLRIKHQCFSTELGINEKPENHWFCLRWWIRNR